MAIKTSTSLITGTFVTVALWWLDVDFALLWGMTAFLLNYVPNIGSIIAAVPAVLMALLQHEMGTAAGVIGLYVAVNMFIGYFLEPRWMGRGLGLSTLVVFVSLASSSGSSLPIPGRGSFVSTSLSVGSSAGPLKSVAAASVELPKDLIGDLVAGLTMP